MKLKRPNIMPGDWQVYTMQSRIGQTVCGRFVQVVHHDSVSRVAEIPVDSPENQTAIASLPKLLDALEKAYGQACEAISRYQRCARVLYLDDGNYQELEAIRDEYKAALLAAGYTEPKTP
jgi:hypothetical protein